MGRGRCKQREPSWFSAGTPHLVSVKALVFTLQRPAHFSLGRCNRAENRAENECASLQVAPESVLCKPAGLKRIGAEAGVKAGLDGPSPMPRLGEACFFGDFSFRNQMANKHWIPVPFHGVGTFWVSPLFRLKKRHRFPVSPCPLESQVL